MNKQNKSYCRVPYDSVTVSPTGRMQLCCEALWTGGSEKTKIKDKDKSSNSLDLMQIEMDKERESLQNLELNSSNGESPGQGSIVQLQSPGIFDQNKSGKINKNIINETHNQKGVKDPQPSRKQQQFQNNGNKGIPPNDIPQKH